MSHFTSGVLRKSRREKEQEAADAKKKEEEENAAQAYADFLDEFEGKEVIRRNMGSGFIKADSKVTYIPSMPAADRAKWRVCIQKCVKLSNLVDFSKGLFSSTSRTCTKT
jgi:hypothetical protein